MAFCRKCCTDKPDDEFLFWPDGRRQARCYTCCMGRSLRRSESRVKAKGGPVERFAVQELLVFWERYGIAQDECYYCGVWLMGMAPDQATLEHLQPVSRGGAHAMHNIVPCCERCNLAASRMDLTHAA